MVRFPIAMFLPSALALGAASAADSPPLTINIQGAKSVDDAADDVIRGRRQALGGDGGVVGLSPKSD